MRENGSGTTRGPQPRDARASRDSGGFRAGAAAGRVHRIPTALPLAQDSAGAREVNTNDNDHSTITLLTIMIITRTFNPGFFLTMVVR